MICGENSAIASTRIPGHLARSLQRLISNGEKLGGRGSCRASETETVKIECVSRRVPRLAVMGRITARQEPRPPVAVVAPIDKRENE